MSLDSIVRALTDAQDEDRDIHFLSDHFYAQGALDFSDIVLTVDGVGSISFPIQMPQIQALLNQSSAAKFGYREDTLFDKTVRDTSEISADGVSIHINPEKLKDLLSNMQAQLGLSDDVTLVPHLHNLLIYAPGQFFKPHQDSEKIEGMVATLVMVLPCPHIGGDLVVRHKNQDVHFESESLVPEAINCAAFYADCQHEVERVKQGYRIALTFNLVLESKSEHQAGANHKYQNPALVQALTDHFEGGEASHNPAFLVYLLDHSYSEHSLRWPLLKGHDQMSGLALQAAAHELNLVPHLALTEIHQSWQTDGDEEVPELYELLNEDVTFSNWFDEQGRALSYGDLDVSDDEMCSSSKLEDCEPDEMHAEGWMGNYGNTADYWYRRAAIIMWRKEDQIVFEFKLNLKQALIRLTQLTEKPGQEALVKTILKRVHPLLKMRAFEFQKEYLNFLTKLACYIQDPEMASVLLSKFPLTAFDVTVVDNIAQWQKTFGVDWSVAQLTQWVQQDRLTEYGHSKTPVLLNHLDDVIRQLLSMVDTRICAVFLQHQIDAIKENHKRSYRGRPSEEDKKVQERVIVYDQCLKASLLLKHYDAYQQMIDYVIANPSLYPEIALVDTVLMLISLVSDSDEAQLGYLKLKTHVLTSLSDEVAHGARLPEDWSIMTPLPCGCERCKIAMAFLQSPTEIERQWPLVADGRSHIDNTFRQLELPVDLSVIEIGRPYKLVMKKNRRLFVDANARFEKVSECYRKMNMLEV